MSQDAIVKFVALKSDSPGVPMNELTALVTTELNAYRPALEDHQVSKFADLDGTKVTV